MLGVNRNGAFAEMVVVPERAVYLMPQEMPMRHGAYIEPVAASGAVLNADLGAKTGAGLIYGDNRIAELTRRVMVSAGYSNLVVFDPDRGELLDENSFDFAVETVASSVAMCQIVSAMKAGGIIIIKSRQYTPVELYFPALIKKELTIKAVQYVEFEKAIAMLGEGVIQVDDILGGSHSLSEFEELLTTEAGVSTKEFFDPTGDFGS